MLVMASCNIVLTGGMTLSKDRIHIVEARLLPRGINGVNFDLDLTQIR